MSKTWTQLRVELDEAKFKIPSGQKELKRSKERAGREQLDIIYAEDRRGKVHVYVDGVSMGDPYRNLKDAEKEMKDIKKVMMQMREDNISLEEILGAINEIN